MKKKALIPLIVLVIITILFIGGCSTIKTDKVEILQNDDNLKLDKEGCWSDRDCQDGKICINDQCLEFFNISECEGLTGMFSKDICLNSIAVRNNDPNICKKMEVNAAAISTLEIYCYTEIAIAKNNDSICDILIDIKSYRGSFLQCQKRFAISKLDSSYCNKIAYKRQNKIIDEKQKEDCIRRVNFAKSHPDFPKEGFMSTWDYIAKTTNNESYCEYITSSFDKKDCEKYFGIES